MSSFFFRLKIDCQAPAANTNRRDHTRKVSKRPWFLDLGRPVHRASQERPWHLRDQDHTGRSGRSGRQASRRRPHTQRQRHQPRVRHSRRRCWSDLKHRRTIQRNCAPCGQSHSIRHPGQLISQVSNHFYWLYTFTRSKSIIRKWYLFCVSLNSFQNTKIAYVCC